VSGCSANVSSVGKARKSWCLGRFKGKWSNGQVVVPGPGVGAFWGALPVALCKAQPSIVAAVARGSR
jgi:hypothetical protein